MNYQVQKLPEVGAVDFIYFVGIKGVGMAPLALIAVESGIVVSGSDLAEEFITDPGLKNAHIHIDEGFDTQSISLFFEGNEGSRGLVITTGAHKGYDNPQVQWAKQNGIPVVTQGQALALFMKGDVLDKEFEGIAVAGSHGKTTVSSLMAVAFTSLGLDPTYSVGTGEIISLGNPGKLGQGRYFIAEADEYASEPVYDRVPKFLSLNPKFAIFNNIDFDHPDIFNSIEEIEGAFLDLSHNIQSGGLLFVNGDDSRLSTFHDRVTKDIRVISYGLGEKNTYVVSKIHLDGFTSRFVVSKNKNEIGFFELSVPGKHNVLNALSVIALLSEMGYRPDAIRNGIRKFVGSKRRLEVVGKTSGGAQIIDDYGHHPQEIVTTLTTLKGAFLSKKIVVVFQPHTYSRTKALLSDFAKAFQDIHKLILLPIFKSQRDTEHDTIEEDAYVQAFSEYTDTEFKKSFDSVIEYVDQNYGSQDFVILTIGAGDVYKIAYKLKK